MWISVLAGLNFSFFFVCVSVFFTLTDRGSTISSNIYAVADPVRRLLDRKTSEKRLQSSNESKTRNKNKTNNDKYKNTYDRFQNSERYVYVKF